LRIFDEHKAKEFYVDFLGFSVDWEHRFEADLPLYLQVSLGDCRLHLTEHHGDCAPGAALRIETNDVEQYCEQLSSKKYGGTRPSVEETPFFTRDMSITDPFYNRLTFSSPVSRAKSP
jgi:catechol 2,3-dioxygenase-like lactoylglutathione lyase family enzyme